MEQYEDIEESKWKTALWIILYAIASGALLAAFSLIDSVVKYLFSLLALFLIIRLFKKYDKWSVRIVFIISTLIIFFGAAIIIAAFQFVRDNPMDVVGL